MKVVRTTEELRATLADVRSFGRSVGFVPTMGALHEGHLSLLRQARLSSGFVVLSIFVNPLQFGPDEDLATYPRTEEQDLAVAEREGTDLVFIPDRNEMYPDGAAITVRVGPLGEKLEGSDRPGHFDGVATVVAKLFNLVQPDVAWFGQKDAQQLAVIKQLVRDLSFPVPIEVAPTVREGDGLALSSRNAYLSSDERPRAAAIYRALERGREELSHADPETVEKVMWESLLGEGMRPSYAKVVDPDNFGPPNQDGPVLLVIAAYLGTTRLIDNVLVERG